MSAAQHQRRHNRLRRNMAMSKNKLGIVAKAISESWRHQSVIVAEIGGIVSMKKRENGVAVIENDVASWREICQENAMS